MAKNSKQTSTRVATVAGKTLGSGSSSAIQKTLAGSALRQAGSPAQTGAKTEDKASRALDIDRQGFSELMEEVINRARGRVKREFGKQTSNVAWHLNEDGTGWVKRLRGVPRPDAAEAG